MVANKEFKEWLDKHYINGPSNRAFIGNDWAKVSMIYYSPKLRLWGVKAPKRATDAQYYLVLRKELNLYLKRDKD